MILVAWPFAPEDVNSMLQLGFVPKLLGSPVRPLSGFLAILGVALVRLLLLGLLGIGLQTKS